MVMALKPTGCTLAPILIPITIFKYNDLLTVPLL